MLEITIKSKETSEGYTISSLMNGEASGKEIKAIIKGMLMNFTESADEGIVISALEEYAKERQGIKDE